MHAALLLSYERLSSPSCQGTGTTGRRLLMVSSGAALRRDERGCCARFDLGAVCSSLVCRCLLPADAGYAVSPRNRRSSAATGTTFLFPNSIVGSSPRCAAS